MPAVSNKIWQALLWFILQWNKYRQVCCTAYFCQLFHNNTPKIRYAGVAHTRISLCFDRLESPLKARDRYLLTTWISNLSSPSTYIIARLFIFVKCLQTNNSNTIDFCEKNIPSPLLKIKLIIQTRTILFSADDMS